MVETSSKPVVTITGISGFIGMYVVRDFLQDGGFTVRGTVRGKTEEKVAPIKEAMGELYEQLEIVEADLLNPESLADAIAGSTFVVHTASPFPLKNPKNADELIKPAVEGTLAVMKACHKHGVKRLVITSSCAAIMDQRPENRKPIYNCDDWSDLEYQMTTNVYSRSKTMAERAAWNFIKELPEAEKFELVTICPSFVVGRALHYKAFTSGEIVTKMFTGEFPVMKIKFPFVRVEDVAMSHLRAIKVPEAANNRFVLNKETKWMSEVSGSMAAEFNPQGFNVKHGNTSYALVWVISIFMKELNSVLSSWDFEFEIEHKKTVDILGIEFKNPEEGVNQMIYDLLDHKLIPDKRKKK